MVVEILLLLLLVAVCTLGVGLAFFQGPGTWVILAMAVAYDWMLGWEPFSSKLLITLLVASVLAEVLETLSAAWAAKRGGASRRAMWWGVFGGILGALLFSIPVPIFGTLLGAMLGCFIGAFLAETTLRRDVFSSGKSGVFAAIGRTIGAVIKLTMATVMALGVILVAVWGLFT